MTTARQVLKRYHSMVPEPITLHRIEEAGYNVDYFLKSMIGDLLEASDWEKPEVLELIRKCRQIRRRRKYT